MSAIAGIFFRTEDPCVAAALPLMVERLGRGPESTSSSRNFPALKLAVASAGRAAGAHPAEPTWSEDGVIALFFSGEEFSVSASHEYAGPDGGSAAAVIRCYRKHGPAFVAQLNGQFSGLLVDTRGRTVILFNDRFGLNRIYYHENQDGFFFATEAKALLAALPSLRRLDHRGVAESVALGCVQQNRTLFSDVCVLPPASAWLFRDDGRVERRRYFDAATWEQQAQLGAKDYNAQLQTVFARAVKRCTSGDAAVGLSLTGGLDSRAVIAWSDAKIGGLPCYTFGSPYRDCADVRIARQLASLCQHPHLTIPIADDFFAQFDVLAAQSVDLSDGTMDVSGAVELYANRRARAVAPVRLTGNYGSEIVRSHIALRPMHVDRTSYTPEFGELLDAALETYEAERQCDRLTFIAFKQMPWYHSARRSIETAEISPRSPFLDNELVALVYRAPTHLKMSARPMLELIAAGNNALTGVATDRGLYAHASSVAGISARWQNFSVKAEYAYDYGMPQWLARADQMLSRLHLERLFLGRHKFYHFRIWYRDRLREYVSDQTSAFNGRLSWYRPGIVQTLAKAHLAGRANHTLALHRALTFQLIDRLFLTSR